MPTREDRLKVELVLGYRSESATNEAAAYIERTSTNSAGGLDIVPFCPKGPLSLSLPGIASFFFL